MYLFIGIKDAEVRCEDRHVHSYLMVVNCHLYTLYWNLLINVLRGNVNVIHMILMEMS